MRRRETAKPTSKLPPNAKPKPKLASRTSPGSDDKKNGSKGRKEAEKTQETPSKKEGKENRPSQLRGLSPVNDNRVDKRVCLDDQFPTVGYLYVLTMQ